MIHVTSVTKRFRTGQDDVVAMNDLDFEVDSHCFFTLLGPSGCGKSTLLRCIAGLETPEAGEIRIGSQVVFSSAEGINVPTNKRRIGMVFQSYAIWPHMTVYQNVAFPLEVQKQENIRARAVRALEMVELAEQTDRYASRLSGGQQQRVAFARAIVAEPDVLLLDEPLSNLDAALREQMCAELRRLHERLRFTTIYVTHDQAEALSLSDKVALMRAGRFVEIAAPETLYNKPKTVFGTRFIGGANIIEGMSRMSAQSGIGSEIQTPFGTLQSCTAATGLVTLFIRPEHVQLVAAADAAQSGGNVFSCTIQSDRFLGDSRHLELLLPANVVLHCKARSNTPPRRNGQVQIYIAPEFVEILKE